MNVLIVQKIVQLENKRLLKMNELSKTNGNVDKNEEVRLEIIRLTSEIINQRIELEYENEIR